jgi:acyl-CoA thioester hydrolase
MQSLGPVGGEPVVFVTKHRVRFREVDMYGHMNMAHYLTYFQDHRFEGMRNHLQLGIEELLALPIAFHIRAVEIEYLLPMLADQEFTIKSFVTEWKSAQCYVALHLFRSDNEMAATGKMRVGCIEKVTGRPCMWPEGIRERFYVSES